mmetsp:Transcript_4435/g.13115  ORF Transcript_4435/g.13115 Transcript_4435/m.13115 type:complete len:280 (-) Transcript_4435:29-868(-)
MVFYLVGLGLGDEKDITVRGLEAVRACDEVWLESYTSVLGVDVPKLEAFYGRPVKVASRETVESECDQILRGCASRDVALLVVGDSLCATTHTDIALRAREMGATVEVVLNASVMGAVGKCGLQLYSYGQTVSIPFFEGAWRPTSFYGKIQYNRGGNLHTLCLLDIKVREQDFDVLAKTGRTVWLPPRFMTVARAVAQLLEAEETHGAGVCGPEALAVGMARLGQPDEAIVCGTLAQLRDHDLGGPLHCLVLCAPELHELEAQYLEQFRLPVSPPVPPS